MQLYGVGVGAGVVVGVGVDVDVDKGVYVLVGGWVVGGWCHILIYVFSLFNLP
jgi:hypothetical protein